jgi:hypothetical protein
LVIKTLNPDKIRIQIGIKPKMLDPDKMNTDPQPAHEDHEAEKNE